MGRERTDLPFNLMRTREVQALTTVAGGTAHCVLPTTSDEGRACEDTAAARGNRRHGRARGDQARAIA